MYAISFDDKNFKAYQSKLDTLGQIIHALDTIPAQQNTKVQKKEIAILDQSLSMQYLALKKQIDDLIIFADQNFAKNNNNLRTVQRDRIVSSDSVINRILSDTLARLDSDADTIEAVDFQ